MARLLTISCLLFCLNIASGCQKQNEAPATQPEDQKAAALPDAEERTLIELITVTQNYRQWPMFPCKEALYQGQHPTGPTLPPM